MASKLTVTRFVHWASEDITYQYIDNLATAFVIYKYNNQFVKTVACPISSVGSITSLGMMRSVFWLWDWAQLLNLSEPHIFYQDLLISFVCEPYLCPHILHCGYQIRVLPVCSNRRGDAFTDNIFRL